MTPAPLWRAETVLRTVRGWSLHEQNWEATGVSIEQKKIKPGDLYIAIDHASSRADEFVASAFEAGAQAAIVSKQPKHIPPNAPVIFVDDAREALMKLAKEARARMKGKVLAVLGIEGLHSMSSMLRLALGAVGSTFVSSCHHDTLCLPFALANLPSDTEYGIFEMPMHCDVPVFDHLKPDVTIIPAAEDFLFSIRTLPGKKIEHAIKNSIVIVNRDGVQKGDLIKLAKGLSAKKTLFFSEKTKADAFLIDCTIAGKEYIAKTIIMGKEVSYMMSLPCLKEISYSLASLLAAFIASGKIRECATALLGYEAMHSAQSEHNDLLNPFSPHANKNAN